jgi:hypothetical protein
MLRIQPGMRLCMALMSKNNSLLFVPRGVACQQVASFARATKFGAKKPKSKESSLSPSAPPPMEITDPNEAWVPVTHKESGQVYYWNTITDQTTALGAPNPNRSASGPLATQMQQPQQQGGLGSVMMEGMAFGAGSAVAHQVVGSFFGSSGSSHSSSPADVAGGGGDPNSGFGGFPGDTLGDSDGGDWDV